MQKLFVASVAIATVALSAPVLAADMPPYPVAAGPVVGALTGKASMSAAPSAARGTIRASTRPM
jgi:hypothetical protein